jgi:TRAP transporter TAXI family solute receptor
MWLIGALGVVLLIIMIAAIWRSLPEDDFTILTGREGGAYYTSAVAYSEIAAEKGFHLALIETAGSPEVIEQLERGDAGIGFVQGGAGLLGDPEVLSTMASVFYEPLWFFYRTEAWQGVPVTGFAQLNGKRVAVGEENSGTNLLATLILSETAVTTATADFVHLATPDAIGALAEGSIDGAFMVVAPSSPRVLEFLSIPGVELMDVAMAQGYAARHGYLNKLTLYAGTLDPARALPSEDKNLISTVANLVVRNDFHPDLLRLMTIAAVSTHSAGGIFEERFAFPNLRFAELPVGNETLAYLERVKQGDSMLDKYLPFWLAALIDRYLLLLLPIGLILFPFVSQTPVIYQFLMRNRINRWYEKVHEVEENIEQMQAAEIGRELARLDEIDDRLAKDLRVPVDFMPYVYDLRLHIAQVESKLERRRARLENTHWVEPVDPVVESTVGAPVGDSAGDLAGDVVVG